MKTILILLALSIPPPHVARPIPALANAKQESSTYWKGCEQSAFDVKLNAKSFICTDKKNRRFEVRVTPLFDAPLGEW
jgi:hypothetical protein